MRAIISILFWLLCTSIANCSCTSGLIVFPTSDTISQNPIFILEGYSDYQDAIYELNKKYNIYLESNDQKIKLNVLEIYVGQYRSTQAILKPEVELEAGREYSLMLENAPEYLTINKKYELFFGEKKLTYKVKFGRDTVKPLLKSKPKEVKKLLHYPGCGPQIIVVFTNPAIDESEIFIKTTLKNFKTGKETTYYIIPDGNKINVGHDMCAGAFDFDKNLWYEVEFSFMDASGNMTAWAGDRIKFSKPTKATRPRG